MNGEKFVQNVVPRIDKALSKSSNPKARRILQDNCPVINSAAVMRRYGEDDISVFNVPRRSADLNPIENLFSAIRKALYKDAIDKNITSESFNAFQMRVISVMRRVPKAAVDALIDSMWRRLQKVMDAGGDRINY